MDHRCILLCIYYIFPSDFLLKEIQETVLRLLRTADQLVHSAHYNAEGVKKRLEVVDEQCENFMFRMDSRRKNLALAIGFFSLAQMVSSLSLLTKNICSQ